MDEIKIVGARIHNLKNINVNIPKNNIVAITGVSGSGKSSLAFDILYEEGRTRYLEAIGMPPKVQDEKPFDSISGLSPTIAIEQRIARLANPRSTVGTKTGIYTDLRRLYATEGKILCPICKVQVNGKYECDMCGMKVTRKEIKHFSFNEPSGMCLECKGRGFVMDFQEEKIIPDKNKNLFEICKNGSGAFGDMKNFTIGLADNLKFDIDSPYKELPQNVQDIFLYGTDETMQLKWKSKRFEGLIELKYEGIIPHLKRAMEKSTSSYRRNIIEENFMTKLICPECKGYRINQQAREVLIADKHIGELNFMGIEDLIKFLEDLNDKNIKMSYGRALIQTIINNLNKIVLVGLSYLTLDRSIPTLSGGEIQRINLMSHLESEFGLNGLIYILDEPTLGMHALEKINLTKILGDMRDLGNSIIIVEHDPQLISIADHIIDMGPGPGTQGGQIVYQGNLEELKNANNSLTGQYFAGLLKLPQKNSKNRRKITSSTNKLIMKNVNTHNLKDLEVEIPLGVMVGVAGVSGSGKSSLISDTLVPLLKKYFKEEKGKDESEVEEITSENLEQAEIIGWENLSNCYVVNQAPIGRSRNSFPASYIGIWDQIRKIFAKQPSSKKRKYSDGHFSFNSDKGRCPNCKGEGLIDLRISFLSDIELPCEECKGTRYKSEILEIKYKGKNIDDVLKLTVTEALELFKEDNKIFRILEILDRIGMGYITLGQPATTLSGGEAQRIKLAKELGKSQKNNALFILDEPSAGLHFYDVIKLIELLDELVEKGNSVIIIEHDIDILSYVDWLIELGPGGGPKGGYIIGSGTPEEIKEIKTSNTAPFLKMVS